MSRMLTVVTGWLFEARQGWLRVELVVSKAVFCVVTDQCKRLLQDATDKTISTRNIS
jgi:hypothetical protein